MKYLSYTERLQIEALYTAKLSQRDIAKQLGRHYNTICNEIKRGLYERLDGETWTYIRSYSADIAQQATDYAQTAKGVDLKLGNRHALCAKLSEWILNEGCSPAVCATKIPADFDGFTLSASTIYAYIRSGLIPNVTMKSLPDADVRKQKTEKVTPRPKRPPAGKSIEKRPSIVLTRETFGHWEMDSVIGKAKGKCQSLVVLTERKTRFEIIFKVSSKASANVVKVLDALHRKYGADFSKLFQTITVDNGTEFSDVNGMEYDKDGNKRTDIYYCHPYSSCERGSNERQNRIIRRFLPKGKSLYHVTQSRCDSIAGWMNAMPRKILNWCSSADLFEAELTSLLGCVQGAVIVHHPLENVV